ncbi:hypothetical protein MMC21_008076 [Puttea exsequens]|nr:hypothetical protein [Puttea exsequens]
MDRIAPDAGFVTYNETYRILTATPADLPRPYGAPVPDIQIHRNGFACDACPKVYCCDSKLMGKHCKREHGWGEHRNAGRPQLRRAIPPMWTDQVVCQRLFNSGHASSYYAVRLPTPEPPTPAPPPPPSPLPEPHTRRIQAMVDRQHERLQRGRTVVATTVRPGHATEANPWLRHVRWPELLAGKDLRYLTPLTLLPVRDEAVLQEWDRALGEVIRCARRSLAEKRVNVFDTKLVNLFTERSTTGGFALITKLQQGTYDRYRRVWPKLLCFLLRACEPQIDSMPAKGQLAEAEWALDRPFEAADLPTTDLCTSPRYWFHQCFWLAYRRHFGGGRDERYDEWSGAVLQRALCRLSICLLDHQLNGRLRESIVVNFVAINGFDEANGAPYGPRAYTSSLSALVKITQLLVIQEGVYLADRGVVSAPVQHLQALRERFLLKTRRTPFVLILDYRAAGKRIRDNSTVDGFVRWNESYTVLQFKETTVDFDLFRSFVWRQIDFLRRDLHELLQWEPPGQGPPPPSFALSELRENAANIQVGWSFLQHEANRSQLGPYNRWLLDRVVHTAALRQRWFHKAEAAGGVLPRAPAWDARIAALYMKAVKRFMQRLAMLALIMSGQPARGMELLSLRFSNTQIGGCRNIFLVYEQFSFVTL